jgi:serine protease
MTRNNCSSCSYILVQSTHTHRNLLISPFVMRRGVAPDVEAFIVRVFTDEGDFDDFKHGGVFSSDLIAAAMICVEGGANIISASLGGSTFNQDEDEFFRAIRESHNIITVAASGNDGSGRNVYPASYDAVISVGASTHENALADFSTLNGFTDVLAPGK